MKKHADDFSHTFIKDSLALINVWRAAHSHPINTFQATLRKRLKKIWLTSDDYIIAQRLKRLPSIIGKLKRFDNMALSTMQDVWWLRVIVPNISDIFKIKELYRDDTRLSHKLLNIYDYVFNPKEDWYRSVHIIYEYRHPQWSEFDGLKIELQIRTRLQHAWATAVETVGTFLGQWLKSNQWEKKRLDFFSLVSAKFALIEWTSLPKKYQSKDIERIDQHIKKREKELDVYKTLESSVLLMDIVSKSIGSYVVISSNLFERRWKIRHFAKDNFAGAQKHYMQQEIEANKNGNRVALVSTDDIKNLRRAYPNAFGDTQEFLKYLDMVI